MSTPKLSLDEIAAAFEAMSPEESVEQLMKVYHSLPEGKQRAEFRRHAKTGYVTFVDEAGKQDMTQIKRDVHPVSRVFSEYANRKELRLDALRFSLNGRILDADCSMTAEQLGMDADYDVIHVRMVPKTGLTTIRFVDEVGAILDLDAHPHLQLYRLFQTYSAMRGVGSLWPLLQFTCKGEPLGEPLAKDSDQMLSRLEITGGIVVYVSLQMHSMEEILQAVQDNAGLAQKLPHCFVNQRVAEDHKPSGNDVIGLDPPGEGGLTSEEFGTVVGYSGYGDDTVWTAEYPNNITKQYTRGELISCMQTYYCEKNGFERDVLTHLEQQAERLQSEMSSLGGGADADASILNALSIEQEIEHLEKKLVQTSTLPGFRGIVAEQTLDRLAFNLGDVRRALVMDRIKSKANKPVLKAGDTVFAKWRPSDDRDSSWIRGAIESAHFEDSDSGYGPRRGYCVKFDNGDVQEGNAEDQVTHEIEHRTKRDLSQTKWVGVEHRLDSNSTDRWASKVGWFVTEIDGIEEPFTYLYDALRAYDAHTVECNGFNTEEEQLNSLPSDGWSDLLEEYEAQKVDESDLMGRQRLRVQLLLSRERIAHNSGMHAIGISLFHLTNRTPINDEDDGLQYALAHQYQECEGQFLDGNVTLMREELYPFALIRQCIEEAWDFDQLCRFFIATKGNIDRFLRSVPVFMEGYDAASEGANEMMAYLRAHEPPQTDAFWLVNIVDTSNNAQKRYVASKHGILKEVLARYAQERGTSVKSLRVELGGSVSS